MLAAQVVYTNVEEDRSPHRRRGFQLWLWTKDLPKPVLDEVEQRLNTFARLTPAEAKQLRESVPRRVFAPLVSGGWVMLAEAVPLDKPDKFGRGGRFHAHALLIDRAEFENAGADPFAVFDSIGDGKVFDLRDPLTRGAEEWKGWAVSDTGLPRVELHERERKPSELPPTFRPLVVDLVAWLLGGPPAKTVALPVGVADAEAVVREVHRLLPPSARLGCAFDTLWTGRGKFPPAVCGAGSAALLQAWAFRQFVRLEPDRKPATPLPADPVHKRLADWSVNTPTLTDADRKCAEAVVEWVAGRGPLPNQPTETAVMWAGGLEGLSQRWEEAVSTAVAAAFPPPLLALAGVREKAAGYFGGWGVEGASKLAAGVPVDQAVGWVSEAVFAAPHPALSPGEAGAIFHWQATDGEPISPKLKKAAARWLPTCSEDVCDQVRRVPPDHWYRCYCRDTLPADMVSEGGVAALVDSIAQSDRPPPGEAELLEAVMSGTADPGPLDRLRLLLRAEGKLGGHPEQLLEGRAELRVWAATHLLPRFTANAECVAIKEGKYERDQWEKCFAGMPDRLALLGVRLPAVGTVGRLIPHLIDSPTAFRNIRPGFDPQTFHRSHNPFSAVGDSGWKQCGKLYQKKESDPLASHLRGVSDEIFRSLANEYLFPKATARFVCRPMIDGRSYFVGAAVWLSDPNDGGRTLPLLLALVNSVFPVTAFDDPTDLTPPKPPPKFVHRFRWLVVRLLGGSEHLLIPE